jgi:hypothetical protein
MAEITITFVDTPEDEKFPVKATLKGVDPNSDPEEMTRAQVYASDTFFQMAERLASANAVRRVMAMHTIKEFCSCGSRVVSHSNIGGIPPSGREFRSKHQGAGHNPCSEARADRALRRQQRRAPARSGVPPRPARCWPRRSLVSARPADGRASYLSIAMAARCASNAAARSCRMGLPHDELYISCTRKDGFSYAEARRIARQIRRSCDDPVSEYFCHDCKHWHVGTNVESPARSARKRRTRKRRGREQRIQN